MDEYNTKKHTWEYWENISNAMELADAKEAEAFKKNMELFSEFLSNYDKQYQYNKTFLPLFCDSFLEFRKYFSLKFWIVKKILEKVSHTQGITLVIDRYWRCQTGIKTIDNNWVAGEYKEKCTIYDMPNYDWVCTDKMKIECSLLVGTKRYLFHGIVDNILEEECINREITELLAFINVHTKEEKTDD